MHKKEAWKKIYQHIYIYKHQFSLGGGISDLHFPLNSYMLSKISTMNIYYFCNQKYII